MAFRPPNHTAPRQLLRLAEESKRSHEEVRTALEIIRAIPSSLTLEANLRSKPTKALKERQALFGSVFDILFPPRRAAVGTQEKPSR